jgi:hypothetical protein
MGVVESPLPPRLIGEEEISRELSEVYVFFRRQLTDYSYKLI